MKYVVGYLVALKKLTVVTQFAKVQKISELFHRHGKGLAFTKKIPVENELQFLDITMPFSEDHACWCYNARAQKELPPYQSAHSKD